VAILKTFFEIENNIENNDLSLAVV
jgi:hypothetical protein